MSTRQKKKDRTCYICKNVGICNHPCCRSCDLRFIDRKTYSEHKAIEHPTCTYCATKFMKKHEYHKHHTECKRIYDEKQRIITLQDTIRRNEEKKVDTFFEYETFIKERYKPTMTHIEVACLILEVIQKSKEHLAEDIALCNYDESVDIEEYIDPLDLKEFIDSLRTYIETEIK